VVESRTVDRLLTSSARFTGFVGFLSRNGRVVFASARHASSKAEAGARLELDSSNFCTSLERGMGRPHRSHRPNRPGFQSVHYRGGTRTPCPVHRCALPRPSAALRCFWGAQYTIVEDPDGIAIGLMSLDSNRHTQPPCRVDGVTIDPEQMCGGLNHDPLDRIEVDLIAVLVIGLRRARRGMVRHRRCLFPFLSDLTHWLYP
jgi:hypothetical protein